ncbi:MAG: hypothetical protein RXO30_06315 [Thermoproteus sp.]
MEPPRPAPQPYEHMGAEDAPKCRPKDPLPSTGGEAFEGLVAKGAPPLRRRRGGPRWSIRRYLSRC